VDQQDISRETLVRLRADRVAAKDPAVVAGLDSQIRLHAELAGEPAEPPQAPPATKPTRPAKAED
jgi:hypothetical protein